MCCVREVTVRNRACYKSLQGASQGGWVFRGLGSQRGALAEANIRGGYKKQKYKLENRNRLQLEAARSPGSAPIVPIFAATSPKPITLTLSAHSKGSERWS